MILHGTLSIPQLVEQWSREQPTAPVVLIDFPTWRQQIQADAFIWFDTHTCHFVMADANTGFSFPLLSWPEVPALPQLPKLPNLSVPHISVTSPEWLTKQLFIDTVLPLGSRLAMGASVATLLFFFGPVAYLEGESAIRKLQASFGDTRIYSSQTNAPTTAVVETPSPSPTPTVATAEDVFSLSMPALNINSLVVPNVDPSNPKEYEPSLKEGIAHAKGTALPDQLEENKTIYLFAHSTDSTFNIERYNAQFYALKDAEEGMEITVRFWGEDYVYRVVSKEIVNADDVSYLVPQTERQQLVLQTCYPPGTTWKRLIVVAEPVEPIGSATESNQPENSN